MAGTPNLDVLQSPPPCPSATRGEGTTRLARHPKRHAAQSHGSWGSPWRVPGPFAARERLVIVGGGMAGLKLVEELVGAAPAATRSWWRRRSRARPTTACCCRACSPARRRRPTSSCGRCLVRRQRHRAADRRRGLRPAAASAGGGAGGWHAHTATTGSCWRPAPTPSACRCRATPLPGVITFRDLADVARCSAPRRHRAPSSSAAACSASRPPAASRRRGLAVTLIHIMPRLMERQLDARAAALLKTAVESKGIDVVLEAQTAAIEGDGQAPSAWC